MCRTAGRRCEAHWDAAQRDRYNARRRAARNQQRVTSALRAGDADAAVRYSELQRKALVDAARADAEVDRLSLLTPDHVPTPGASEPIQSAAADGDYRGGHSAPTGDDGYSTPLHATGSSGGSFPDDVLDSPDLYGAEYDETMTQVQAAAGNPNHVVTIYRAVPPGVTHINRGDWVALSREYADTHAYDLLGPDQDGVVITARVPASAVFTDGNSLEEWGYGGDSSIDTSGTGDSGADPGWWDTSRTYAPADARSYGDALEARYGDGVEVRLSGRSTPDAVVSLSKIAVPAAMRGNGVGRAIMADLVAEADRNGWTVSLTPDGEWGSSVPRLRKFYAQFGFVPNSGRAKDYRTKDTMIRPPAV